MTQLLLTMATRRAKKFRQQTFAKVRNEWLSEAFHCWKSRRFAELHRLRVKIAQNGRGPKKRDFRAPRANMSLSDWETGLAAEGVHGGMACEKIDPEPQVPDGTLPCDEHYLVQEVVVEDMAAARRYLIKAPKRRAFPKTGVPAEALLMALDPEYTSRGAYDARKNKVGIGHALELRRPKKFIDLLYFSYAHIRMSEKFSTVQLQSSPFTADKKDGRAGIAGLRVLHCFSSFAMSWFGGNKKNQPEVPTAHFAHGGLKN